MKLAHFLLLFISIGSIKFPLWAISDERIIGRYNLSEKICRPSLSAATDRETLRTQFACFYAEFMPFILFKNTGYAQMKEDMDQVLAEALQKPTIKYTAIPVFSSKKNRFEPYLIFYTIEQNREVLLLQKHLLETSLTALLLTRLNQINPSQIEASNIKNGEKKEIQESIKKIKTQIDEIIPQPNDYLIGLLLGMSEKELQFMYQKEAFIAIENQPQIVEAIIQKNRPEQTTSNISGSFETWDDKTKESFKKFVLESSWQKKFAIDKSAAIAWIEQNKQYKTAALKRGVEALYQPLKWEEVPDQYIGNPHFRKIFEEALEMQKISARILQIKTEKHADELAAKKTIKKTPSKRRKKRTTSPEEKIQQESPGTKKTSEKEEENNNDGETKNE